MAFGPIIGSNAMSEETLNNPMTPAERRFAELMVEAYARADAIPDGPATAEEAAAIDFSPIDAKIADQFGAKAWRVRNAKITAWRYESPQQ
jgi:hypothetical protein